jgi:micrococcal nuclease
MKRIQFLTLLLAAFIGSSFTHSPYDRTRAVYDGDTILLENGMKVRYLGIDAPEMGHDTGGQPEFMAPEARDLNLHLVGSKRVRLEFDEVKEDRHGRVLAYVFLENGEMVNALLVRKGLAYVSVRRPNVRYFSHLLQQQRLAMQEGIGLWGKKAVRAETYYVSSAVSTVFHRPKCKKARGIPRNRRLTYDARADALWEGLSPCRECKP